MRFILTHYYWENLGNYRNGVRVSDMAREIDIRRRRPTVARIVIGIVILPHYRTDVGMESIISRHRIIGVHLT